MNKIQNAYLAKVYTLSDDYFDNQSGAILFPEEEDFIAVLDIIVEEKEGKKIEITSLWELPENNNQFMNKPEKWRKSPLFIQVEGPNLLETTEGIEKLRSYLVENKETDKVFIALKSHFFQSQKKLRDLTEKRGQKKF